MATIPIRDVPGEAVQPSGDELILIDNGIQMQKATINDAVEPKATEIADQKIADLNLGTAAQANVEDFATAAQGRLADSAVQPTREIIAGDGLTGGGALSEDRTISLNSDSIASLAKADTAVQSVVAGANVTVDATDPQNPIISASGSAVGTDFATVADLLADNNGKIGYAGSGADTEVQAGDIVTAQGFRYEVIAPDASMPYIETAGGVRLAPALGEGTINLPAVGAPTDGIGDALPAETLAHSFGKPVEYPNGPYAGIRSARNIYSASYNEASWNRIVFGLEDAPVADPNPVLMVTKFTGLTRDTNPKEWDSGAIYASLIKKEGDAFGAALTGSVRADGGSGDLIGGHFRGEARHAEAAAWGGWSYAAVSGPAASTGAKQAIVHEFNANNQGPDVGWNKGSVVGSVRGLVVVTADGSGNYQVGLSLGSGVGESGKWWTGIHLRGDSFGVPTEPATVVGNGEAFRIDGSNFPSQGSGGIRFLEGYFRYGISFTEASYGNNCAILLGNDQRISVGAGPASTRYIAMNADEHWLNINNMNVRLNGTQVLTSRRTGWGVYAGTGNKTPWNTATVGLEQLAQTVKALIDDLKAHGLIGE